MKAELHFDLEFDLNERSMVGVVIWRVPEPVRGSDHPYKYRAAFIVDGECVLRFDNEAGKGDHIHVGNKERPYEFVDPDQLMVDYWAEVDKWLKKHGG